MKRGKFEVHKEYLLLLIWLQVKLIYISLILSPSNSVQEKIPWREEQIDLADFISIKFE